MYQKALDTKTWLALARVFQSETTETNIFNEAKRQSIQDVTPCYLMVMVVIMMVIMMNYNQQGRVTLITCVKGVSQTAVC